MLEKAVQKYVLTLIKAHAIADKEKEIYQYYIVCALESSLIVASMTGVAFYFHKVLYVWAFNACFFLIRNRTGGFHFDSFWKCYLGSVGLEIFVIHMVKITVGIPIILDVLCLCMFGVIIRIGAMNHINMNYSKEEFTAIRKKARIVSCGIIAVIWILKIFRISGTLVLYMEYAVIVSGIMLLLGIIAGQEANERVDERRKFL